jgi:hypothetical protein
MNMKALRSNDVRRAVDVAGRVIGAVLHLRHRPIGREMLNSAGSVAAEWYVETLWHYLAKRSLLNGVSRFEVEFAQPARLSDRQIHFSLPHRAGDHLAMHFHVRRRTGDGKMGLVSVAAISVHGGSRRRHGVAPEPPFHPYGLEVRERNLNSAHNVSWFTLVAIIMDVARRGAQLTDSGITHVDPTLLYVVPRFSFTPFASAAAQHNLFVYSQFAVERPWVAGKTSTAVRVTMWAVANEEPWPIAESVVTVVRTSLIDDHRRPVDEMGKPVSRGARGD